MNNYTKEEILDFLDWYEYSDYVSHFWRQNRVLPTMEGFYLTKMKKIKEELFDYWVNNIKK